MNWNNLVRIIIGTVAVILAWAIGGYIGGAIFPDTQLVNKMETGPDKLGSSVAILVVSFVLGRYLFHSFIQALICLVFTEVLALLIILFVTGLFSFSWPHLRFNISWLFTLTWNVVATYIIGAWVGQKMKNRLTTV